MPRLLVVACALSPIDLIAGFIPLPGYLDDGLLLLLLLPLVALGPISGLLSGIPDSAALPAQWLWWSSASALRSECALRFKGKCLEVDTVFFSGDKKLGYTFILGAVDW